MKILVVSASDSHGGAHRAAYRLHRAFLNSGLQSEMKVGQKYTADATVYGPTGLKSQVYNQLRGRIARMPLFLGGSPTPYARSTGFLGARDIAWINASGADVVNLHHVYSGYLSIRQVAKIKKPIVWTFHDMWPFCGTEHYADDSVDARWREGYSLRNRPAGIKGLDLDRWIWLLKVRYWRNLNCSVVCPSRWLAECVQSSLLFKDSAVYEIPYSMDFQIYRPWPEAMAREILKIPPKEQLVLCGSAGNDSDGRKGMDLLFSALSSLKQTQPNLRLAIFGQEEAKGQATYHGYPVHWLGRLKDEQTLALSYSAADVMVVPSRMDNLPQTGTEAQSCGCPVVAFRTGGLSSVVEDGVTGYLAKAFDPTDLAMGIREFLGPKRAKAKSVIRERAVRLWSESEVAGQYHKVMQDAIDRKVLIVKNKR